MNTPIKIIKDATAILDFALTLKCSLTNKAIQSEKMKARPLRELEIARLLGEENDTAKEKVISINTQILELRKQL